MDNSVLTVPLSLILWTLGILLGIISAIIGAVYANLKNKAEAVDNEFQDYRKCTDKRIEMLLLDLTKVNERVISKTELADVINDAVRGQFLEWENKLFRDGRLKPIKKGE